MALVWSSKVTHSQTQQAVTNTYCPACMDTHKHEFPLTDQQCLSPLGRELKKGIKETSTSSSILAWSQNSYGRCMTSPNKQIWDQASITSLFKSFFGIEILTVRIRRSDSDVISSQLLRNGVVVTELHDFESYMTTCHLRRAIKIM